MQRAVERLEELAGMFCRAGIDIRSGSPRTANLLNALAGDCSYIIAISDYERAWPLYLNEFGLRYFGLTGIPDPTGTPAECWTGNLLNPTYLEHVSLARLFFNRNPSPVFTSVIQVRHAAGMVRHLYFLEKELEDCGAGRPVLSMGFDVADLADGRIGELSRRAQLEEMFGDEGIAASYKALTCREREILHLIADDMTSQDIGERLYIAPSTVDTHRKRIIRKLGVRSSLGLVRFAFAAAQCASPDEIMNGR